MNAPFKKLASPVLAALLAVGGSAWAQNAEPPVIVVPAGSVIVVPNDTPARAATPAEAMAPAVNARPSGAPSSAYGGDVPGTPSMAPAAATNSPATDAAAAGSTGLPQAQSYGNVSYVTGGVTHESQPAFKDARRDYPLNIEIYQKSGAKSEFTADADVKVKNQSGATVLEARADGPYVFAKVPPGTYRIEASLNGKTSTSTATVRSGGSTRAMLVFPQGTD